MTYYEGGFWASVVSANVFLAAGKFEFFVPWVLFAAGFFIASTSKKDED